MKQMRWSEQLILSLKLKYVSMIGDLIPLSSPLFECSFSMNKYKKITSKHQYNFWVIPFQIIQQNAKMSPMVSDFDINFFNNCFHLPYE